jgi:hypothetical protein
MSNNLGKLMIKTLRITSIIAAIVAAVLLVCAAVYGVRSDPTIETLLQAPNALDRFTASKGQRPDREEGQVSPLVKQAADFARYLNPPPPPAPMASATEAAATEPAPPAPVSAKFDLVGTSYYASHPELSLALIDEPGKGLNWVRQGSSIAYLTIEKVSDGSITVRDGQRTFEMTVKVDEQWRNLVKGAASEAKPPATTSMSRGLGVAAPRRGGPATARRVSTELSRTSSAEMSARDKIGGTPAEENVAAGVPLPTPTAKDLVNQRLVEDIRASRISPDEAIQMMQMAETLEQLEELRKQKSAPPRQDANSPEPNTPHDANQ